MLNEILNVAKENSFTPLLISTGCCGQEVTACLEQKFSVNFTNSPRHANLLIIAGPITKKAAPAIKRLFNQMPSPKYVISVGNCACSGGIFTSYSVIDGVDKIIPVDIYLPMCPPSPKKITDTIEKLKEKINSENQGDIL
ncbi:MAG: NADH-quinone oxidoreductase subunit B [Candidatus Gastranaerophilaceae bacterium]